MRPPRAVLQSIEIGWERVTRSGRWGQKLIDAVAIDDELCVAVKGGEDVEMPKEELKAVILAKGKGVPSGTLSED